MCKYCEQTDNLISEARMTSTGRLAFADLRFDLENNELDMEYGLLEYDGSSGEDTTWSSALKFNHCPMCGRKLS